LALLKRALIWLHSFVLWCVWALLVLIWLATLVEQWRAGNHAATWLALVAVGLLFILYFAEGIELAVTDLLDKEPDQVRERAVRRTLQDIQSRSAFFYAQRQVFVVVIIAFTSLITAYAWIYVPFAGRVSAYGLPFWFSLVFTTLTVLWFCQVTPKRLAVLNSELFLAQSRFVWLLIKAIGALGLPNPSNQLVALIQQHSDYRHSRHLLPSRAAHYALTSQLEGLSLDRYSVRISLDEHGAAGIVKRFLVLFLHGAHGTIDGSLDAAEFAEEPQVRLLGLYLVPAAERFESLAVELDTRFQEQVEDRAESPRQNLLAEWTHTIRTDVGPSETGSGQRLTWAIEGELLPERFWPQEQPEEAASSPYAALLYQVEAQVTGRSGCSPGGDHWSETVVLPCRTYAIAVDAQRGSGLSVVATGVSVSATGSTTALARESERYTKIALARRGSVEIPFPLQGASYTLRWRVLPGEPSRVGQDGSFQQVMARE
jgi:hypothetical protein